MKTTGIVILILGCVSTFGGIMAAIGGHKANLTGLGLVVLGIYLINRANKKKEEEEKKKQWEQGNTGDK
ncbi:MAG: putative membrane protein [Saprospiraceae bacterium]|jgi:uncharacterized membrane protein